MNITYDSTPSNQQKQWFQEGVSLNEYPDWPAIDVDITVTVVAEPPCAGHKDTMCTTLDGAGSGAIYIRQGFDDPKSPINAWENGTLEETKRFYLETVNHELGHVVSLTILATDELKSTAAALFTRRGGDGEGYATGTLDDWNPLDAAHGDRIQEAIAEVFKDAYLPDNVRILENNSNWDISEGDFKTLMEMLLPPVVLSPGTEGWHSDDLYPAGLFSDIDNSNPGDNGGSMWQGCSAKFTDVPAGAQFGVYEYVVLDMTGSTCMSFGGFVSGDYYEFIECPAGHAAPVAVSPAWGSEVPGDLAHPYTGGHAHIQKGLESQGFVPVGGTWKGGGVFAAYTADPTKDYYVFIYHAVVCSSTGGSTTIASVTSLPKIGGDLYPTEGETGPPPDPPPYPYEPETVSGSQGDGQTMRF